jgi:hypothetical protein
MPRITKVKNQAATPAPATTPTMEEVAEKPIVQQIMEAFDEKPTQPIPKKAKAEKPPKEEAPQPKTDRKTNAWINHVREYRAANPDVSYKQAMVNAKATYKNA